MSWICLTTMAVPLKWWFIWLKNILLFQNKYTNTEKYQVLLKGCKILSHIFYTNGMLHNIWHMHIVICVLLSVIPLKVSLPLHLNIFIFPRLSCLWLWSIGGFCTGVLKQYVLNQTDLTNPTVYRIAFQLLYALRRNYILLHAAFQDFAWLCNSLKFEGIEE